MFPLETIETHAGVSLARFALFFLLVLLTEQTLADGEVQILAEADATVDESHPDETLSDQVEHVLFTGIMQGEPLDRRLFYLRFNLKELPRSSLFHHLVVEDAYLSLMATAAHSKMSNSEFLRDQFLVTVRSCQAADWVETEITWNTQPCSVEVEGDVSGIINVADLPKNYEWDVTRSVAQARGLEAKAVTFSVSAIPLLNCPRDPLEGRHCYLKNEDRVAWLHFASRERNNLGIGVIPHMLIKHELEPTTLLRVLEVTLSLLSAFAVSFGVYKIIRGLVSRKNKPS